MSTIASPRPSIALSSRRNSNSTDTTSASTSNRALPSDSRTTRRNRTALRDYYNLKTLSAGPTDVRSVSASPSIDPRTDATEPESEFDRPDFSPQAYVSQLLAQEGLENVLSVEAKLVTAIRSLDGERKALVYDNYSKLIAATDTIRRMRETMDPMTPTTGSLTASIEKIAETARELAEGLRMHVKTNNGEGERKRQERETVKWVLGAPGRLTEMVQNGETEAAKEEWGDVVTYLDRWKGAKGTEEVKRACLKALEGIEDG